MGMAAKKKTIMLKFEGPACENCVYSLFEPGDETGFCRRYPMRFTMYPGDDFGYSHDPADVGGWCGEHVLKVN